MDSNTGWTPESEKRFCLPLADLKKMALDEKLGGNPIPWDILDKYPNLLQEITRGQSVDQFKESHAKLEKWYLIIVDKLSELLSEHDDMREILGLTMEEYQLQLIQGYRLLDIFEKVSAISDISNLDLGDGNPNLD